MLSKMRLENFKSWRELELDLSNVNFLFGTNSSGKTSILQALLLLKQTAMGFDRNLAMNLGGTEQDYVDFGSYRDLVFRHRDDESLGIGLDWRESIPSKLVYGDLAGVRYEVDWGHWGAEGVTVTNLLYHLIHNDNQPTVINAAYSGNQKYQFAEYQRGKTQGPSARMPLFLQSCYYLVSSSMGSDLEDHVLLQSDLNVASRGFESFVDSVVYLGPLRSPPQRTYVSRSADLTELGPRGERTIEWLLPSPRRDDDRLRQVATWLNKLGVASEFRLEPIDAESRFYEPRIRIKPGEVENTLLDVGFGVSQVLPVVAMLFAVPEGSIVLIEQPELHLHPSAQAGLADLFLEVAEKRNIQLIVESHSEHILTRLQRRIGEAVQKYATPEHIRLNFCQLGVNGSTIQPVTVDRFGDVSNWPEGFFGDISSDLEAKSRAALKRRRDELAKERKPRESSAND